MIGTTVGNYRIVERLGDGGMGAVFRAVDEMLDREVAIKVLKPELARNAALIERFRLEAVALARLNHPRIATLHGLERHGESLLRPGASAPRAAELCAAVLDALDHAHDKGVVHRDIKPANMMLASNGAVKVMDFGIARLVGKSRQTQVGHAVGTPMYMAPEQLRGEEVDGRTDLYAVGAVLFELVTGRLAFEADSDYGLMMKQLNEPPPAASSVVAEVPSSIDDIIRKAMAKHRDDRFANAVAFRHELEAVAGIATPPSRRTPIPAETRLGPAPASDPLRQAAAPSDPARDMSRDPARESSRDPARDAFPATRLVDEPPRHTPAPTRLAGEEVPPARTTVATAEPPRQPQSAAPEWLRDWRTFAIAATLLVAAGLGVRLLRPSPDDQTVPAARGDSVVTTVPGAQVASSDSVRPARRENASALLINPPASGSGSGGGELGGGAPVREVTPPAGAPTRPPRSGGAPGGGSERPVEDAPVKPLPQPEPVRGGIESPPPRVDAPKPPPSDAESESEAMSAIRDAIASAASSLSGSNTGAASAMLGGAVQDQWIALMKEGRVSLSVNGAPDVQLRGSRASAEFDANVNVRSPFGANKRRGARFTAELQRSGSGWRVTSLRPQGGLELK
ncbi:MAG: protein kinase [Gemmatimonadetes bacterium]|nr:protein kinase [Gemmatimonadota bacterium]